MDYYPEDYVLKVGKTKIDGQKMGLVNGEEMKVSDLLNGLLVYSANDAAEVLAENFNIDVIKSKEKYKWGYDVKLKDLKFMARIDVSADNKIVIIDNQTLKIGNNYMSFSDLAKQGYILSINQPVVLEEINLTIANVGEVNSTEVKNSEINKKYNVFCVCVSSILQKGGL